MTLNKLVKLTTLWTTGPWSLYIYVISHLLHFAFVISLQCQMNKHCLLDLIIFFYQNLSFKVLVWPWKPGKGHKNLIFPQSQWCIGASLVKFHLLIHEIKCSPGSLFSSPELCSGWAIVITFRPSSVHPSVRPSVNNFKRLLLWNRWANFAQISYGASLGWGNEKLLKWSRSVDQDGRHAHIW